MNAYDQVPYPPLNHPQTHPDHLSAIGMLFGMEPAPVERCRLLEVGCANGTNLVPMAWSLPNSQFLGIDLAQNPVVTGNRMIADLNLKNVRLCQKSILQLTKQAGTFDYIIAHGVFSWVTPDIQKHLLSICRECLAPQGIAFVSYNTYPGAHLRQMTRDMMRFHTRGFDAPEEKIRQATALLRFLAEGAQVPNDYGRWLKSEWNQMLSKDTAFIYHDDLAEWNQPFYFVQFMEQAFKYELQYLGEADFFEMTDQVFTSETRQALEQIASDRILKEQYLDFLKCRHFRQTLLCHREAPTTSTPVPDKIPCFEISSPAKSESTHLDLRPGIIARFATSKGASIQTDYDIGKAALSTLAEKWPGGMPFEELLQQTRLRLSAYDLRLEDQPTPEALSGFLLELYSRGIVNFRSRNISYANRASDRPVAHPIARWQIHHGNTVTSLFHMSIEVEDDIGRLLLTLLDGTNDRKALKSKLCEFLKTKDSVGPSASKPSDQLSEDLEQDLERNLEKLAQLGLLVA